MPAALVIVIIIVAVVLLYWFLTTPSSNPEYYRLRTERARTLALAGTIADARRRYQSVIDEAHKLKPLPPAIKPHLAGALCGLGDLEWQAQQRDAALKHYQ